MKGQINISISAINFTGVNQNEHRDAPGDQFEFSIKKNKSVESLYRETIASPVVTLLWTIGE